MKQIEQLLLTRAGLDSSTVGAIALQGAVETRMRKLGLAGLADYKHLIFQSQIEWELLVEMVVVGETWFFRDEEAFAALVHFVQTDWIPSHQHGRIELLSLACSTGEEPYSLAIALTEAGLAPERFHIEAIDINRRALARARRGFYRANSFRTHTTSFRDRYFFQTATGYQIDPVLGDSIQFRHGNIAGERFETVLKSYDFIFCRNVLIYLDERMQRKALARLEDRLTASGVLFVGPAEHSLALGHGFQSANMSFAFAARKRAPTTAGMQPGHPNAATSGQSQPTAEAACGSAEADLLEATRLADAGFFDNAASICETHLRKNRVSATAYYLLGLTREARGQSGAEEFYRKALYLDPDHCDSLAQLTLLAEQNGDSARAIALKRRMARARSRTLAP